MSAVNEARSRLHLALLRMQSTSTALAEHLTDETLDAYVAACIEAQSAQGELLRGALERAKAARR